MKKTMLIIGIAIIALNVNAQYSNQYKYEPPKGWKSAELYLPATILLSTFSINSKYGEQMSNSQRQSIAATGMATSVLTHFVFRKIRESKKSNRNLLTRK